eukprot:CAMPEP_0185853686 /NCGR_PEP_ID=MMETSP1354-20130828/19904_1 /TAXON_ID=708628 /ORGANISM="Erythrolobus madagascarensis, Strain CCMP3276" /LENGTH=321 /DNA_ID=CAMNT_0028555239 /DNA_START=94 /DNA_END=1055 /DNA_ORIENTATION=+
MVLLQLFSAELVPHLMVRAPLKELVCSRGNLLRGASVEDLVGVFITERGSSYALPQLGRLTERLLCLLCQNRGRQRRELVHILEDCDTLFASLCDRGPRLRQALDYVARIRLFVVEYFLLLGFECELYSAEECDSVYFNLYQVKCELLSNHAPIPIDVPSRELHTALNDIALNLSRALFETLSALQDFNVLPKKTFELGTRKSWYTLRFGKLYGTTLPALTMSAEQERTLLQGYADYESYVSARDMLRTGNSAGLELDAPDLELEARESMRLFARLQTSRKGFLQAQKQCGVASSAASGDAVRRHVRSLLRCCVTNALNVR